MDKIEEEMMKERIKRWKKMPKRGERHKKEQKKRVNKERKKTLFTTISDKRSGN